MDSTIDPTDASLSPGLRRREDRRRRGRHRQRTYQASVRAFHAGWYGSAGALPVRGYWVAIGVGVALALAISALAEAHLRWVLASALVTALVPLVFVWPDCALFSVLCWASVLGLVRRFLLPEAPWTSLDPLLLVTPAVVLAYCVAWPVFRRPWNRVTTLLGLTLVVSLVQALSPLGPGLRGNLAGTLFVTVPLLWYFVGRHVRPQMVDTFLRWLPLLAAPLAAYGTFQVFFGLPAWDALWTRLVIHSYTALYVAYGVIRPFGTFASSAEYESFLLVAAVVAFGIAIHSRGVVRFVYGILTAGLWGAGFLGGSRGGTLLSVAGMALLWAFADPKRRGRRVLMMVLVLGAAYGLLILGQKLGGAGGGGTLSALVSHQAQGLSQPFNPKKSTALLHLQLLYEGIIAGLTHPWGYGLGSTSIAGARFGGVVHGYEVDFSNMFVSCGIVGGVAYLAAGVLILKDAMTRRAVRLAEYVLPAILLVVLFAWLNGGYYFLSALIWLVVGSSVGRAPASPKTVQRPVPHAPPTAEPG